MLEKLPAFINLFHPHQATVAYYADKLQTKLAGSMYSEFARSPDRQMQGVFVERLSELLVGLLHAGLLKNDFFIGKTL